MECRLLLAMERATLFLLVSYFVLGIQMIIENVSRKLKETFIHLNYFLDIMESVSKLNNRQSGFMSWCIVWVHIVDLHLSLVQSM